jgi:hypothetical protein
MFCVHKITRGRKENAVQVTPSLGEELGVRASPQTVRRALKEAGFGAIEKPKKPLLSETNRRKRLASARQHVTIQALQAKFVALPNLDSYAASQQAPDPSRESFPTSNPDIPKLRQNKESRGAAKLALDQCRTTRAPSNAQIPDLGQNKESRAAARLAPDQCPPTRAATGPEIPKSDLKLEPCAAGDPELGQVGKSLASNPPDASVPIF